MYIQQEEMKLFKIFIIGRYMVLQQWRIYTFKILRFHIKHLINNSMHAGTDLAQPGLS